MNEYFDISDRQNISVKQSNYYDINSFTDIMKSRGDSFSLFSLNIAGVKTNMSQLEAILNHLGSQNLTLSVILLQETHSNAVDMC